MADAKISELTALTGANVATDDELPIVDTDAGSTKRIIASELLNYINANLARTVTTVTTTNASFAPSATFETVVLNHASVDIDITYAAVLPTGNVAIFHAVNNGATSHTVKLAASQTFDGTNNTAEFNAADDRLMIQAISATRAIILYNNSVTFSST